MPNVNALKQQRRAERLKQAAIMAGFATIDQLAQAIINGRVRCYYRTEGSPWTYEVATDKPANILVDDRLLPDPTNLYDSIPVPEIELPPQSELDALFDRLRKGKS